jgi:alpha-1,3-mannosyltransferase
VPPYLLPLLILSKRLHSIFVLRLFNDCFAVASLFLAIYAYQRRNWTLGSVAFSWGLGIKMSLLLALPGIVMVLGQALPTGRALRNGSTMIQIQALIAMPFVAKNAKGYLMKAFEFSRVFLYKWTVNWRFVHEETFLSKEFAAALLAVHAFLLVAFVTLRWTRPSGLRLPGLVKRVFQPLPDHMERSIALRITPVFVTTSILTSMAIGMLCARSLHYQFYAYIAWTTPFLLWRTNLHPVLIYCIWAAQEWAWNVYPSTNASSGVVVGCLAVQVLGVWWGTRNELVDVNNMQRKSEPHRHVD